MITSPSGVTATMARTSTSLCLVSFDTQVMLQLGYGSGGGNGCPVVLTLTCGGVTLYDRVPWSACSAASQDEYAEWNRKTEHD